jgi:signal transduction histidine kinase
LGFRLEAWALQNISRPPMNRFTGAVIIFACVLVIGWVDYITGTAISLQVFYFVPIALAVAWFGLPTAFVTAVCSIIARIGGDYILGAVYAHRRTVFWNALIVLAMYLILARVLQSLLQLRRELETRVEARTAALAQEVQAREQLQHEMLEVSERERRSIGNDLHDGLGQHLTAMAFAAEVLSQQLAGRDPKAAGTAQEIVRLAEQGIVQSRQLARGLLLTAIEPANLSRELEELAATVQRQTGVRCHYEARQPPLVGDSNTASHLFRIAQEAVRNSIKHAQPTALNLSLNGENDALVLTVSDNGPGLPATVRQDAGIGLRVMAHRAKVIGGDFSIESNPGQGTRIRCRVPLPSAPAT